ncbi:MAG: PEP-utilizing enzyme [Dehalococcoidia bacterium]
MVVTSERVCEWDALPNPQFNFWTIGNVSEVVPGIVRPFTATFYHQVEHRSTKAVAEGIDALDLVPSYPPPTANFLNVFAGRYALNLAWANAVIATWQVAGPSGLMDQFITSTDGTDIKAEAIADTARAQRTLRKVRRVWGQLERSVARDRERVKRLRATERARDFSRMSERGLWRQILALRQQQVVPFTRHLYVSGAAGDHTDRLNKLLDEAIPGHDPGLVIALTSALRNVESARPAKGAWDVAKLVARRGPLADDVRRMTPNAIAAALKEPKDAGWRAFARAFDEFIAEFGFRGQREVDPSAADWEEEPAFALSTIKAYLDAPKQRDPHRLEEQSARAREAIEAQVAPLIPRHRRTEYRELLAGAQKFTRMRESTKANWVRTVRTLRPPLRELGRRLVARGLLADTDDIFWLTVDEVEQAVRGDLIADTARAAVARRRDEAAVLEQTELPEVFTVPIRPAAKVLIERSSATLQGMPVSAGTASGPARVVLSAEAAQEAELQPGEVLVAPYTDAPWTPLFVPAAGVVVETGGVLSHAATVAREFGIPAVVAVKGATTLIKTGQQVTVDGTTGVVTIPNPPAPFPRREGGA